MSYALYNGKMVVYNSKYGTYAPSVVPLSLDFKLSVIRNLEMNNIVGDAGSSNLTITNISGPTGMILTVPNLPNYSEFNDPSSWLL
jgi:hypothetical protein